MAKSEESRTFIRDFLATFPNTGQLNRPLAVRHFSPWAGPVDAFIEVQTVNELKAAVDLAYKYRVSYQIIGRSTSVIWSDIGFPGLIILDRVETIHWDLSSSQAVVGGGIELRNLINLAAARGLGGIEYLSSIPGTVAGALVTKVSSGLGSFEGAVKELTVYLPEREDKVVVINTASQIQEFVNLVSKQPNYPPVILGMRIQLRHLSHEEIVRRIQKEKQKSIRSGIRYGYVWDTDMVRHQELIEQIRKIKVRGVGLHKQNPNYITCRDNIKLNTFLDWVTQVEVLADKLNITLERRIKIVGYLPSKEENHKNSTTGNAESIQL